MVAKEPAHRDGDARRKLRRAQGQALSLRGKRVAVVVPAFEEELRLGAMLGDIPEWVDRVVVVDDASSDATSTIASASPRGPLVVRHPINRGVGAAIVTGYKAALADGADAVVVMAGDGQMDPADLERLLLPVLSGRADYSKGDRFSHPDILSSMPFHRFAAGRALSRLTRAAAGIEHLSDSQSGYTAISRRALEVLDLDALYPRYGYPNDLIGMLARARLIVEDVPIRPVYRGEKSGLKARHLAKILGLIGRIYARRMLGAGG